MPTTPDRTDDSPNPYQAVYVETPAEIGRTAIARSWAGRLGQLGFVIGFSLGIVAAVLVMIRVALNSEVGILWIIGSGLYVWYIVTCVVGLPLAIVGWIIGVFVDLGSAKERRQKP